MGRLAELAVRPCHPYVRLVSNDDRGLSENHGGARTRTRSRIIAIALVVLVVALTSVATGCAPQRSATIESAPHATYSSKRMPDGKQWMTRNLSVAIDGSYCYEDAESNCRRYGRLYTWDAAQRACASAGTAWRLPTNDEWQRMAKHFGGVRDDSQDGGKAAYAALLPGGSSGFDVQFGGGRSPRGEYARGDAHGFYWTASESDSTHAFFYNLGRGGLILNRHGDGEKQSALAVRCVSP